MLALSLTRGAVRNSSQGADRADNHIVVFHEREHLAAKLIDPLQALRQFACRDFLLFVEGRVEQGMVFFGTRLAQKPSQSGREILTLQ